VNTSYNVAAPIAQSPQQAIDTLRRANGMDGVFMFASEGPVVVAWARRPKVGAGGQIEQWLADWRHETAAALP
jgi:carbamoyltransferase